MKKKRPLTSKHIVLKTVLGKKQTNKQKQKQKTKKQKQKNKTKNNNKNKTKQKQTNKQTNKQKQKQKQKKEPDRKERDRDGKVISSLEASYAWHTELEQGQEHDLIMFVDTTALGHGNSVRKKKAKKVN